MNTHGLQLLTAARNAIKEFCKDCHELGQNNTWKNSEGIFCEVEACEMYILREAADKFEVEPDC